MLEFEWDAAKDRANQRKHGVAFPEALTVFAAPDLLLRRDREIEEEVRYHAIGTSEQARQLLVVHCVRERRAGGEVCRIISARKLTPAERRKLAERQPGGG